MFQVSSVAEWHPESRGCSCLQGRGESGAGFSTLPTHPPQRSLIEALGKGGQLTPGLSSPPPRPHPSTSGLPGRRDFSSFSLSSFPSFPLHFFISSSTEPPKSCFLTSRASDPRTPYPVPASLIPGEKPLSRLLSATGSAPELMPEVPGPLESFLSSKVGWTA